MTVGKGDQLSLLGWRSIIRPGGPPGDRRNRRRSSETNASVEVGFGNDPEGVDYGRPISSTSGVGDMALDQIKSGELHHHRSLRCDPQTGRGADGTAAFYSLVDGPRVEDSLVVHLEEGSGQASSCQSCRGHRAEWPIHRGDQQSLRTTSPRTYPTDPSHRSFPDRSGKKMEFPQEDSAGATVAQVAKQGARAKPESLDPPRVT